jgi:acyl-CoA thioesterase I
MKKKMPPHSPSRRKWIVTALAAASAISSVATTASTMFTLYTFGDSILDSGRYNDRGLDAGQLMVRNDDALFPEFMGRDLQSRGPARLVHRAVDGSAVDDLPRQLDGLRPDGGPCAALLTMGGNDLLRGLAADTTGRGLRAFELALRRFVNALPVGPLLLGTVYDPTFGDDRQNFLGVPARLARRNHIQVNEMLATAASQRPGDRLVDLHAHFLRGQPSWFTRTIEPSLIGASEVRRVFISAL